MKKISIFILCCMFSVSCEQKYHHIMIDVHNQELIPIGKVSTEFSFETEFKGDTLKCLIRTIEIYKDDELRFITAELYDDNLSIMISSFPHDFDCEDCFLTHDIKFDLLHVKPRKYNVNIWINGGTYYSNTK